MEYAVEIKELTKRYDGLLAVDRISLGIKAGEIFGFLGPNGAGKTTTIRMLTGLSRPSSGTAAILDLDIKTDMVEIKRHIGVVPELSNLYDELSAVDNLIFMAQLYGVPRSLRVRRAEELLAMFRLSEQKNRLFRKLSRGMKRGLTIAAGLIHKPAILFLDEPTVGLDVVAARSLRNLISNLRAQGITIFLTTHYLEEADVLCDRIALLVKGRILKIDTPENLKKSIEKESVIEFGCNREVAGLVRKLDLNPVGAKIMMVDNNIFRVYGGRPEEIYKMIFQFTRENNIGLQSINSIKPNLEDAFIQITGLSPTVMAIEKGGK